MEKVKIGGAWCGVLEVDLQKWTVPMLRQEVARRSNTVSESIKLICSGRMLKDTDQNPNLAELGVNNNSKILASKVNFDEVNSLNQQFIIHQQRSSKLARLKAAVSSLAKRHADGTLPLDEFNIELEDQRGKKVDIGCETDQRAIMMGLMLHAKGKQLITTQQYRDALEVLEMGEEAFSLCDPKLIEAVDNVSILQIDMVWCYFMLRDINFLAVAGERLANARVGIEQAHGKDASRVKQLQGTRSPQLALYLRLELLEGVANFHCGKLGKAREALTSAKEKFTRLQVSDEKLSLLMSMGYKETEAKRALKMNEQDVESAINFIVEEREMKTKKRAEDIKHQREYKEQKKYGKTQLGKPVDLQILQELVSIGFEKELAAEALRRKENDMQKALDDLTNPEHNSIIQLDVESKKRKRRQRRMDRDISELVSMGFERSRVVSSCGTREEALNELLSQQRQTTDGMAVAVDPPPASAAGDGASSGGAEGREWVANSSDDDDTASPSSSHAAGVEERDVEMEYELARELDKLDHFSDYDIDITKEAEAINEYLALLDSAVTAGNGKSIAQ